MKVSVFDLSGSKVREASLPESVFAIEPNRGVMHQAFVRQMANARRGTHQVLSRGEVRRTTAKWFRQKGTGNARHGARSAPIFVGGGVAHGPQPRDYSKRMPKKMRRLALRSALSTKAAEGSILVVDSLEMDAPKTKVIQDFVAKACEGQSTLILLGESSPAVERSIRNLEHVHYLRSAYLNVRDLLGYDRIVLSESALASIEAHLGE